MKESCFALLYLLAFTNGFVSPTKTASGSKTSIEGGFGFGESTARSKRSGKKKKKKKAKGLTSDLKSEEVTSDKSASTLDRFGTSDKSASALDRFGLPIQTKEEIENELFPPIAREIVTSINTTKDYTISEIQDYLKDHIDLRLDRRFHENGIAKQTNEAQPIQLKLLHQSPPVLAIENLFSEAECKDLRHASAVGHEVSSRTFTGSLSTRTSTSWFCNYSDVPLLLAKVNHYLNIPLEVMEEPQIVRYQKGQEFSWHYDEVPATALENGGQRLATLLVYLSEIDITHGGGTAFRDLEYDSDRLIMQPKIGSVLLFFPAFKRDGKPDDRTLHRSEVMTGDDEKWIIQMWIHERKYKAAIPIGNSNELAVNVLGETLAKLGLKEDVSK